MDIFSGGLDVATNVNADDVYCNDINTYVIQIYKAFQELTIEELLKYIDRTIEENGLTQTDKDAYIKFRTHYNQTKNPLDLYILACYSFNYQFRFNSKHEFNNPFGKDRSWFNPTMRANLIQFHHNIKDLRFTSVNFKDYDVSFLKKGDFFYADPPYTITTGSYNDGKRGFEGWSTEDDLRLFNLLDFLDTKGVKFALSNASEHKGLKNQELIDWKIKYHTHNINYNYNNSNYQAKNKENVTKEILVTNF